MTVSTSTQTSGESASLHTDLQTVNVSFADTPTTRNHMVATYTQRQVSDAMQGVDVAEKAQITRRPLRGIQIKKETFGYLSLVYAGSHGKPANHRGLYNSSTENKTTITSNFLINSVSESRQEKHQPVLTFGKDYVYFFGEQPRQITVNATLINSDNFGWEAEWWANYDKYMRGTKLAASNMEACLEVDENLIYGFLVSASTTKDSQNPFIVNLTFTLHVTTIVSTKSSSIGSVNIPAQNLNSFQFGNVDLNIADAYSTESVSPISIGESGASIVSRNKQITRTEEVGSLTKWINTQKDRISGYSADLIDFLYGKNLVVPADAAFADFSSGEAQNIIAREAKFYDVKGRSSGKYTDNWDEYPLRGATGYIVTADAAVSYAAPSSGSLKRALRVNEAIKALQEEYPYLDRSELLEPTTAAGQEKYNKLTRLAGRAAFAAINLGVARANLSREKVVIEDENDPRYNPNENTPVAERIVNSAASVASVMAGPWSGVV